MTRRARLIVDPIACDGRGLCAELLPELITVDDWGFPVIADGDVPAGLHGEAAAVVRLCPRLALRLDQAGQGEAPGRGNRAAVPNSRTSAAPGGVRGRRRAAGLASGTKSHRDG